MQGLWVVPSLLSPHGSQHAAVPSMAHGKGQQLPMPGALG